MTLRRLPPGQEEGELREEVERALAGGVSWWRFCPGSVTGFGPKRRVVFSRAYVALERAEDAPALWRALHGRLFVTEKGTEFKCVVEVAPNPKLPLGRAQKDKLEDTIAQDPEYLEFVERLEAGAEPAASAEVQLERREVEEKARLAANGGVAPVEITPLMAFVQARAAKAKKKKKAGKEGKDSKAAKKKKKAGTGQEGKQSRKKSAREKPAGKPKKKKNATNGGGGGGGGGELRGFAKILSKPKAQKA